VSWGRGSPGQGDPTLWGVERDGGFLGSSAFTIPAGWRDGLDALQGGEGTPSTPPE